MRNEKGQSTIEFILTFVFGLSFVLVIFNSAVNHARGYLVHYATFMASRVYLTAENNLVTPDVSYRGEAVQRAKEAFDQYQLGMISIPAGSFQLNEGPQADAGNALAVGGVTFFQLDIDVLGRIAGQKKLDLLSESFLGKEPTRAACAAQVCKAITGQETCATNMDITLYDDGC